MKKTHENILFSSIDLKEFLPNELIRIHPHSASLHYSHAIFEGMSMAKRGKKLFLFHPWLNLERMRYNSKQVGISMDAFPDKEIIKNIFALAAINGFHSAGLEGPLIRRAGKTMNRFYVRPLLFVESDSIGLGARMTPRLLISVMHMGEYLRGDVAKGIEVMLYPFQRNLPLPSIKTSSNYQISIISRMKMEEFNRNYNEKCSETIFLNRKGDLIEGSGENIALLRGNELISPPPSEGAIPGITLRIVSTIAEEAGIKFRFGTFKPDELRETDCLFLTGNAAGVVPISAIAMVNSEFKPVKWKRFDGPKNALFRKLKHEYELIETAQREHEQFHVAMDDWIDDRDKEELHSCADRYLQKMQRIMQRGIAYDAPAPPRPAEDFIHNTFVGSHGLGAFYQNRF